MTATVRAGFIPLLDSAPLLVAAMRGFAEDEGLRIELFRETSWATLRDRLAVRHLDAAHILAPMPIAANLGLSPLRMELIVPMALGFGGNTITVSRSVWGALESHGAQADFNAASAARAMAALVAGRKARGEAPLTLAVVHTHSAHHYELAYWLASAGVVAGRDVELVVVPPPLTAAALGEGQIDGFCAGEPWGTVAVRQGVGAIVTTNAHIWMSSPEKVLGVRRDWAEEDGARLEALIRAVYKAALWCDDPANADALCALLARGEFLGQPEAVLHPGIARRLPAPGGAMLPVDGFLTFAARAATFPWISHALWLYTQMVRWGQASYTPEAVEAVRRTYRPDLYRAALKPLGAAMPSANSKVEGALRIETPVGSAAGRLSLGPDGFFDGRIFDPDLIADYIAGFGD